MEERMIIAKIAVENTAYHFDKAFDYVVPFALRSSAQAGCRVLVPFGLGNGKRQGMILELAEGTDAENLKPIAAVLDQAPLLNREMLLLVFWLKERYFCTLFEAVKLLLPTGINYKVLMEFSLAVQLSELDKNSFIPEEWQVLSYLSGRKKPVQKELLLKDLGLAADSSILEKLLKSGCLNKSFGASRKVEDATQKMVRPVSGKNGIKLSKRQQEVFKVLQDVGPVSLKELCYFTGATSAVVNALIAKGVADFYKIEVYRNPYDSVKGARSQKEIVLSEEQSQAYHRLYRQYQAGSGGVSLLYGITGSGKTLVFTKLIDQVCNEGRGVVIMVPEISLTPQTVSIFHRRYGSKVAVFHSGMSLGERMDEWKRVKRGEALIAVGTRSAIFAPFENLGLIVMDEEQEYTYKSESSPRYHAREVAKFRCAYHKALLILSSATPSVESYYFASTGRYALNCLSSRYGEAQLPEVSVIDMNRELEEGNSSILSRDLKAALQENIREKKQSIVLLNRRGYHTFASCKSCGYVVTCPHCSISMTYHSANHRLMCHYCGYSVPFIQECPQCHEKSVHYSGIGTQRTEEQLQSLLPEARILRLDTDTAMTRLSYEEKLKRFAAGDYDLIVGTQMVAKGLDFENVTLVGVLSADQSLYSDDFRSSERAFDLFTQVVGRSGRGKLKGRAVIQTFTPENNIIRLAACQDYQAFYDGEIQFRKAMLYPPFADIFVIGFVGNNEKKVCGASQQFLNRLSILAKNEYPGLPMRVLNPSPALIAKVSNKYRYKLIIKCRNDRKFREMLSKLLKQFAGDRQYAEITVYADSNPDMIM